LLDSSHFKDLKPAVFLDRDGTLNHDIGYLHYFKDFKWIEGVPEALYKLKKAGFVLAVISNQSGVARGYYTSDEVNLLHQQIDRDLMDKVGITIDGWYFCTHHPIFSTCQCRKPSPMLLQKAAEDLKINLHDSFMVGDKSLDVLAGINAGVKGSYLVLTGFGLADRFKVPAETKIFDDFPKVASFILDDQINN
jgi:D,D-heptose 1,7-bisphosphate phosphatase